MSDTANFAFSVKEIDEETGETYAGQFKAKMRLSWNEQLRQDEMRRALLGDKSNDASVRANNMADMLANLRVCLTEWPKWWENEMKFGEAAFDDTIPLAVWQAIQAEKDRRKAEKTKKADDAAKDVLTAHSEADGK